MAAGPGLPACVCVPWPALWPCVPDGVPAELLPCAVTAWVECDTAVWLPEFRRCSTRTATAASATTTRQPTRIGSALPRRGGCCRGERDPPRPPAPHWPPECGPPRPRGGPPGGA